VYADWKKKAHESKIQEGDKVLLRRERENNCRRPRNSLHL